MNMSNIAYAIWPWGTETREQMVQAAQDITDVGFRYFESVKAAIYAYDMNLDAYREVLKKYNLDPVSFYFHLPQPDVEEDWFSNLNAELAFVAELGVKVLTLQATGFRPEVLNEDGTCTKEEMERELAKVMRFATTATKHGITTCLHPHHNTRVMMGPEIDYMMQNTSAKELSWAPDTAHLILGECDPHDKIAEYADRVGFVHLKDYNMGDKISSAGFASAGMEVYTNFAELGTGSVDFKRVFKILGDADFKGYYCCELDTAPKSNAESAKNNFNFIKNL